MLEEHFVTPEIVASAATHDPNDPSGNFKPPFKDQLLDLGAARVADMDAAGIDVQVLSLPGSGLEALDPATATALVRGANDLAAAAVRAHPTRFAAFASLALQDPESAAAGPGRQGENRSRECRAAATPMNTGLNPRALREQVPAFTGRRTTRAEEYLKPSPTEVGDCTSEALPLRAGASYRASRSKSQEIISTVTATRTANSRRRIRFGR